MTTLRAPHAARRAQPDARWLVALLVSTLVGAGAPAGELRSQTAATVSSVSIGSPDIGDTFERGEGIFVTVTFSATVAVTGSPQLALTIGSTTRQAAYRRTVGNGLVFRYVVQSSDADSDGISIGASALTLNGGTISGAGGAATLGLGSAAVSNSTSHKVSGSTFSAVTVTGASITSTPLTSTTYGQVEQIAVEVSFGRAVAVTGTPQLALTIGTATRQANYVRGAGTKTLTFRYRVQAADVDNNGISVAASALTLNGGTINDARVGGTAATLGLGTAAISNNSSHRVDGSHRTTPVVSGVSVASSPDSGGVYGQGARIRVHVSFNLLVVVTGTPQLELQIGSVARLANYVSGSGAAVLVFEYAVQPTDMDSDGISSADSVNLNGGTIRLASSVPPGEQPQVEPAADLDLGSHALSDVTGHAVDGSLVAQPPPEEEEEEEEEDEEEEEEEEGEDGELGFGASEYEFDLVENTAGPLALGRIGAGRPGGGPVQYVLTEGAEGLFEVGPSSGEVSYVGEGEDAELRSRYVMVAHASEGGDTVEARVTVRVLNVNERPAFAAERYAFEVVENVAGPLTLGAVEGVDLDEGDSLAYQAVQDGIDPAAAARFEVDAGTGEVRYVGAGEDYEADAGPWTFEVSATDLAGLSATTQVVVAVADVNEAPAFADSTYAFEIAENMAGPLALGSVGATDPDRGDPPTYALAEGDGARFLVDAGSGVVRYVGKGEDAETGPESHVLLVTATDQGGLRATARVTVAVVDLNEAPAFREASWEFEVAENAPGPQELGVVEAVDSDRSDTLSYALAGEDAARFEVDAASGAVRYVGGGEDAEAGPDAYEFGVVVRDKDGLTDRASVTVHVLNVNEAPVFADSTYAFEMSENVAGPLALGQVEASDVDAGDVLAYTLASGDGARFEVDSGTGRVRYVGAGEDYEGGPPSRTLVVRATDGGGLGAETVVAVTVLNVNEGPEAVGAMAAMALEAFGAGREEELGQYFRDPDGDPLTYVAESSSAGVAMASVTSDGRLSVRPQAIGSATVTVTASDAGGLSAVQQVAVSVEASSSERARALELALAAFGRSVGTEAVEAVGGRLGMESSGALGSSHVQLGGRSVGCVPWGRGGEGCGLAALAGSASRLLGARLSHPAAQAGAWPAAGGYGMGDLVAGALSPSGDEGPSVSFDPVSWERIGSESSFQLELGGGKGGSQDAGPRLGSGWTVWGRAGAGGFEGRHQDGFTLDGATRSAHLGIDYRFASGLLVGVAGARNTTASDFESRINGAGSVDARLTSAYPYVHWSPRRGLGLWGLAGAGRGDAEIEESAGGRFGTDLAMRVAALGVRQEVHGGFALKADAFAVRITSDRAADLAGVTTSARRLRLAPELSRSWSVGDGVSMRARVEAGARFDGGDAQTGAGAEAGAEFGLAHHSTGFAVDVRGRTLLAHQAEGYRDWGAGLALRLQPGGDQGGLSVMVAPTWGNTTSGAGTLWQGGAAAFAGSSDYRKSAAGGLAADDLGWVPGRVAMELGWGVLLPGGGQVVPFGRWSREGADGHRLNVGTRWTILGKRSGRRHGALSDGGALDTGFAAGATGGHGGLRGLRLEVDVFGEQVVAGSRPPERRMTLQGRIGFK